VEGIAASHRYATRGRAESGASAHCGWLEPEEACQGRRKGLVRYCCCHCGRLRRRSRCRCLTADVYAQLFAIVPLSALGVGPEVSNNMSKFASPSPCALESSTRRACEARLAKALSGPHAARDVCVSCGRARVRRDGKACCLMACVAILCSRPPQLHRRLRG
jgi:hypothetical protein